MPLLTLSLFGGFDCRSAEGRPLTLSTHKARALLAYLAVHAGQRHPRDKLASFQWGDHPEVQARANLRKALSRLRQALPVPARRRVELDAGGLMVPAGLLQVNVTRFETLARYRLARREFAEGTSCLTWLLGIDPFRLAADVDCYAEGLRKAGFE